MSTVTTLTRREQLILEHLPQVRLLARRAYDRRHRQVEFDDLYQAASLASSMPLIAFSLSVSACSEPWPITASGERFSTTSASSIRCLGPSAVSLDSARKPNFAWKRDLGQRPGESELADALNLPIRTCSQLDRAVRAAQPHSLEAVPESAIARRP
ncbi:MAG: hypothetical protein WBW33_33285 [Bryobacteraceae bacterium]